MEQDLQNKFEDVIDALGEHFSSHDFIKVFLAKHEEDYRKWFSEMSLQETYAKIGRLLVEDRKSLCIEKNGRVESETFSPIPQAFITQVTDPIEVEEQELNKFLCWYICWIGAVSLVFIYFLDIIQ